MSDPQLQSLPRRVKYLHFLRTLKSSHVALNHLPKEIFTGIYGWMENEECGVRSAECGVRSAECGVWKMRSMESEEYGKCGVWKMRSIACGNALTFLFNIKNA